MSFFDRLFVEENEPQTKKAGTRAVVPNAKGSMPTPSESVERVEASSDVTTGKSAKTVIDNALKTFEGRTVTIYTLENLVKTLPKGTTSESIKGVLKVTGVSEDDIRSDASERIAVLTETLKDLQSKVAADVNRFNTQIKEAETTIETAKNNKSAAEQLLNQVQYLVSQEKNKIDSIMSAIQDQSEQEDTNESV